MLERLPERARTPGVARAATSPSAVLLAGAGTSAAVLAGLPLELAGALGLACWAVRVALAVPRRRRERIRPTALSDPWRTSMRRILRTRERFRRAIGDTRPGPLRDRLAELGDRIDVAVREGWSVAKQGHALRTALKEMNVNAIRAELAPLEEEVRRSLGGPEVAATAAALRSSLDSARRLESVASNAASRLRLLEARLAEAVARAVELSLEAADARTVGPLGSDVDAMVEELEALRQALEETTMLGPGPAAPQE